MCIGTNPAVLETGATEHKALPEEAPTQPLIGGVYRLGDTLGEGEFGTVRLAAHIETGEQVAIKAMAKAHYIPDEVRLQQMMNHKGVVKILNVIEDDNTVYIVMEHMSKGSLFDLLVSGEQLTEAQARKYFLQLIDAVETCHSSNIAHRDLKAQNILLDDHGNAKIADFGLAAEMVPGQLLSGCCGSPNYAAPELWNAGAQYQGPEVDVWSCGVVLYALLTSTLAYDATRLPALVKKIRGASYTVPSTTSAEANDLLAKMFIVDPAERISMAEIKEHRWVTCC